MFRKLVGKMRQRARHQIVRLRRFQENRRRAIWRHDRAQKSAATGDSIYASIEKMTNWQRSQWAKLKYKRDPEIVNRVLVMKQTKRKEVA